MDGRPQIKVHTDERTQVHSAQSSLEVTHPSINRVRRYKTSVTEVKSLNTPRKHRLEARCYPIWKLRYIHFQIEVRHHGFSTSGFSPFDCKSLPLAPFGWPLEHSYHCNLVAIYYGSTCIYYLGAANLDFWLPVASDNTRNSYSG